MCIRDRSKDSVKNRISSESSAGMSFTEFTYQLVQGDMIFYICIKITNVQFKWVVVINGVILQQEQN